MLYALMYSILVELFLVEIFKESIYHDPKPVKYCPIQAVLALWALNEVIIKK